MAISTPCSRRCSASWRAGPYFLGERFTALDILWGQGLAWILQFGLIPSSNRPPSSDLLRDYVARIQARPAVVRALAKDSELAAGDRWQARRGCRRHHLTRSP